MITVTGKLLDSWQELIDGSLSVSVHKDDVPEDESGNYVLLMAESETEDDTKQSFRSDVVVITDIVTRFNVAIDSSVAEGIDGEIKALIKSAPGLHALQAQSGMQILDVRPETTSYLTEYEAGIKYYRKIVRYTHRIIQN